MDSDYLNSDVTMTGGERALLAGRYRVVKQLGQGGMGSVWLVEDVKLDNKLFAVKMLPSILVANKRAYAQVKREALLAMKLVHTNIVQVRAFEEDSVQGNPFLVMDYIEGESLDDLLAEKGTLSEEETEKVLKPVAEALDYAHGEGVVHRDVKPGNILIRKDGRPFILDFGIAREMQETMTRVTGKLSSGTLMYMSPEQLKGHAPSPAQDIYSFAAMAYECFAGAPPFSRGQIEYQIVNEPPAPLPGGPGSCAAAIMAGLAKKPEDRPKSCAAVIAAARSVPPAAASVAPSNDAYMLYLAGGWGKIVASQSKDTVTTLLKAVIYEYGIGCLPDPESAAGLLGSISGESPVAGMELAQMKYKGTCFPRDRSAALTNEVAALLPRIRGLADGGDTIAKTQLACVLDEGISCPRDHLRARQLWEQAALAGDAYAKIDLADDLLFSDDPSLPPDVPRGKKIAEELSAAGCVRGDLDIGMHALGEDDVEAASPRLARALPAIRIFAENGNAAAQNNLGDCYFYGAGVAQDYDEAVKWYRKAADQGDAEAQTNLGACYDNGEGVEQDYGEAVKWYRKAADQGDADAQNNLGSCYYNGDGVEQDYGEAVKWYRKAADQGDVDAQNSLGNCYYSGVGVEQDCGEAVKWYRKAADQGYAEAQNNLGNCYYNGEGVEEDYGEAVKWYRKAAEQGNAEAQCCLGARYYNGEGVEQDYGEAVKWYRKAADQGDAEAQNNLGNCYYYGEGVEQDYGEAVKWFRKAADQGYAGAQTDLGSCYYLGNGVEQDYGEAVKWFRKAADQGDAEAQNNLGSCYYNGKGVEKNLVEAKRWWRKAAEQGYADAKNNLKNRFGE